MTIPLFIDNYTMKNFNIITYHNFNIELNRFRKNYVATLLFDIRLVLYAFQSPQAHRRSLSSHGRIRKVPQLASFSEDSRHLHGRRVPSSLICVLTFHENHITYVHGFDAYLFSFELVFVPGWMVFSV